MNSYQQRQEAVQRFLKGEHVTHIAIVFKKSRKWVHHWINQYNLRTDELSWFKDRSKAPKKTLQLYPLSWRRKFCKSERNW